MTSRTRKKIFVEFEDKNTVRFSTTCSNCTHFKEFRLPLEKIKSKKVAITCQCGTRTRYDLEFRTHRVPLATERIPVRIQNIEDLESFTLKGFINDVSRTGLGIKFDKSVLDSAIIKGLKKGLKADTVIFPNGTPQLDRFNQARQDFHLIEMVSDIIRYDRKNKIIGIQFNNPDEIYNQRFNKWFRFTVCEFI